MIPTRGCLPAPQLLLLLVLLLGGCAGWVDTTPGGVPIDTRHSARGQDSRVQFLILHYTVADLPVSIKVLTEHEVSAHYLVSDETPPRILRLVPEERRAWHSGASGWQGHRLLNAGSIGIEIVHPGPAPGANGERSYPPFADAQIEAVITLVRDLATRHQIRREHILGHGEVSPYQKEDPGPSFPWKRLADLELVPPWPDATRVAARRAEYEAALPDEVWFQRKLAEHGYPIEPDALPEQGVQRERLRRVLMNFQMRYRPGRHDGQPDAETAALLWVLTAPRVEP
jgi:N-acetylmuramoyl-L-alanine amidase